MRKSNIVYFALRKQFLSIETIFFLNLSNLEIFAKHFAFIAIFNNFFGFISLLYFIFPKFKGKYFFHKEMILQEYIHLHN